MKFQVFKIFIGQAGKLLVFFFFLCIRLFGEICYLFQSEHVHQYTACPEKMYWITSNRIIYAMKFKTARANKIVKIECFKN